MTHSIPVVPNAPVSTQALSEALSRIPPLWPLKHFVAVNPFVGLLNRPFAQACGTFQKATGSLPLLSPREYRDLWTGGTITAFDLAPVCDANWTPDRLIGALRTDPGAPSWALPTFADFLDGRSPGSHWSPLVIEEISKWCAVAFDQNQTTWRAPWAEAGLYSGWKAAAGLDLNPEALGLRGFRRFVNALPDDSLECIRFCVERLSPSADLADFLHRQLVTVSGWAGYLQYRVREEAMRGRGNDALQDLLAIRLAFDAALQDAFGDQPGIAEGWQAVKASPANPELVEALSRWQSAYETGHQRHLAQLLTAPPSAKASGRPVAQAIFCIDVRSEVFRRHLEAALPGLQSIGFAGFFGFPVAHTPEAGDMGSRCPVLLVPPVESCEDLADSELQSRRVAKAEAEAWRAFQNSAASCFSFVETAGFGFARSLNRPSAGAFPTCGSPRPVLSSGDVATLETRANLAEGALRNMSLTRNFARLVLICGHGSQSANNPYASGLDCGACGGHAGDVNARLAAAALNDPEIRQRLNSRGIRIPEDTHFVAGIHNTTTDVVTVFDRADFPDSHAEDLVTLRMALTHAGRAARQERSGMLGNGADSNDGILKAFARRAEDISEVRPDGGLANNAAFVAAPRERTAAHNLQGRVFLHDYDAAADPDSKVLTLILCAPVVVASWINLQYYGSRVNPDLLGSGNKVLHNVLGGIGVVEGNGGDLRVGLPLQSIHDGQRFVHEPRRLSVFIEAEPDKITQVLEAHPLVRQLFDHGWIHLFCLQGALCQRYASAGWRPVS
jgi:uncharacterized protein YbcC (UPF0753/DUF2309 family)